MLDGDVVAANLGNCPPDPCTAAFLDSLPITRRPHASLHALYQGWIDSLLALRAARITGVFTMPASTAEATDRVAALQAYGRLEAKIARLSAAGAKEKQMGRLTAINPELKGLRADRDSARARL